MSKSPGLFLFVLSIGNVSGHASTVAVAACPPDMRACAEHGPSTGSLTAHAESDALIVQQSIAKLRFHIETPAGTVRNDIDAVTEDISFMNPFTPANLATIEMHTGAAATDHRLIGLMSGSNIFPVVSNLPSMHFVGRSMDWLDDTKAVLQGYMTIGKTTRHVEFEMEIAYSRTEETRTSRVGLKARTTFRRSEFGMAALVPLVSDDVKLCIRFEAASSRPMLKLVKSA